MSETMIPTMSFRWAVPSFSAYAVQPGCARLQQLYHTSQGDRWIDVPMVEVPLSETVYSRRTDLDEQSNAS
jgi:hypothetical protein